MRDLISSSWLRLRDLIETHRSMHLIFVIDASRARLRRQTAGVEERTAVECLSSFHQAHLPTSAGTGIPCLAEVTDTRIMREVKARGIRPCSIFRLVICFLKALVLQSMTGY